MTRSKNRNKGQIKNSHTNRELVDLAADSFADILVRHMDKQKKNMQDSKKDPNIIS